MRSFSQRVTRGWHKFPGRLRAPRIGPPAQYFIKPGYQSNPDPTFYDDSLEDSLLYQVQVYQHAAALVQEQRHQSVLDIGCGLGTKLVRYVGPHCGDITGVDTWQSIKQCQRLHQMGTWLVGDLEDPDFGLDRTFDLIISADVIEHLMHPDHLLTLAQRCSHERSQIVLSTPERDLRRGVQDMGPPANPAHVREWNSAEFSAYLKSRGLMITDSRIVDLREGSATCQMVTATFSTVA